MVVETDRYRVEGMMTLPAGGVPLAVCPITVNRRDQEFFTADRSPK